MPKTRLVAALTTLWQAAGPHCNIFTHTHPQQHTQTHTHIQMHYICWQTRGVWVMADGAARSDNFVVKKLDKRLAKALTWLWYTHTRSHTSTQTNSRKIYAGQWIPWHNNNKAKNNNNNNNREWHINLMLNFWHCLGVEPWRHFPPLPVRLSATTKHKHTHTHIPAARAWIYDLPLYWCCIFRNLWERTRCAALPCQMNNNKFCAFYAIPVVWFIPHLSAALLMTVSTFFLASLMARAHTHTQADKFVHVFSISLLLLLVGVINLLRGPR